MFTDLHLIILLGIYALPSAFCTNCHHSGTIMPQRETDELRPQVRGNMKGLPLKPNISKEERHMLKELKEDKYRTRGLLDGT